MTDLVVIGRYAAEVARAIDGDAWVLDEGEGTPAIVAAPRRPRARPGELREAASAAGVAGLVGNPAGAADPALLAARPRRRARRAGRRDRVRRAVADRPGAAVRRGRRAAPGSPVAAFVIAGWPDPPGRVLLDERVLLYEVTDLPVLTLAPGERPDWPVEDWKATEPLAGAGAGRSRSASALEPYREWQGESPGDPRSAPRPRIMEAMLDIVAAEGPVLASRAYAIYNKAAGGKKLTSVARAPLSNSIYHLAREGKVVLVHEDEIPWQGDDLVRLPDTPPVVVRELGPRELVEVPLDEIAELMRRLGPQDDLKRAVLNTYGLVRMTARAEQYLTTAEGLL